MKWFQKWLFRRKVAKAREVIYCLDDWMLKAKMPRHERRSFWRDFNKHASLREQALNTLQSTMKGIND